MPIGLRLTSIKFKDRCRCGLSPEVIADDDVELIDVAGEAIQWDDEPAGHEDVLEFEEDERLEVDGEGEGADILQTSLLTEEETAEWANFPAEAAAELAANIRAGNVEPQAHRPDDELLDVGEVCKVCGTFIQL